MEKIMQVADPPEYVQVVWVCAETRSVCLHKEGVHGDTR